MSHPADPQYRVQVWAPTGSNFAVGTLVWEFANPKNIGYARYINDVGEAFWTESQLIDAMSTVAVGEGYYHVVILRNDEVVWRGYLGEHEATQDDVIFYAYGYEGYLYTLLTGWNQTWTSKQIDSIVSDLWTRAKTTLTYSNVGFVSTGTIQAPVTTSGGGTAIVLPLYKAYYKRTLFALRELTAIATSDTTNICYFEIAYTNDPTDKAATFNFWKNRTTDRDIVWEYGVNVKKFSDRKAAVLARNDLFAVGSGARNQLYRDNESQSTGAYGYQTVGRKQEPIYLSWVRDETDLDRVAKLRAKRALRSDTSVSLYMTNGGALPLNATGAGYNLGDRVTVKINRGATQINKLLLIVGQQVLAIRGREVVIPMVQDRSGV